MTSPGEQCPAEEAQQKNYKRAFHCLLLHRQKDDRFLCETMTQWVFTSLIL